MGRWIRVKGSFVLITLMATGTVCGADGVSFLPRVDYAVGTRPRAAAVGDFNGDRILDLAVANENSNSGSILLGDGEGTFQPAVNFKGGRGSFSLPLRGFWGGCFWGLGSCKGGAHTEPRY